MVTKKLNQKKNVQNQKRPVFVRVLNILAVSVLLCTTTLKAEKLAVIGMEEIVNITWKNMRNIKNTSTRDINVACMAQQFVDWSESYIKFVKVSTEVNSNLVRDTYQKFESRINESIKLVASVEESRSGLSDAMSEYIQTKIEKNEWAQIPSDMSLKAPHTNWLEKRLAVCSGNDLLSFVIDKIGDDVDYAALIRVPNPVLAGVGSGNSGFLGAGEITYRDIKYKDYIFEFINK